MLTVFVPAQEETAFLQAIPPVTATRWHPYAIDLVPIGSGKCHGVEAALRCFGINWSEVFAFGDGDNDYEMLKRAGKGFAMGNASSRLLNGEFEITDGVEQDGVLKPSANTESCDRVKMGMRKPFSKSKLTRNQNVNDHRNRS